jgi:ferredoxin
MRYDLSEPGIGIQYQSKQQLFKKAQIFSSISGRPATIKGRFMMTTTQKVSIDHKKCVGCKACSKVCPINLFTFYDEDEIRTFTFGTLCSENCSLCEKVCTGKAIKLTSTAKKEKTKFYQFEFPRLRCTTCNKAFTTKKMAEKVNLSLSARLKELKPTWIKLCPECKLQKEAVQIVGTKAELHSVP